MQIAKTKEESDLLCEQEISHILKLDDSPSLHGQQEKINLTKQCFFELPERVSLTTIKTKKYGVLIIFDKMVDFLESRYNKSVMSVYCNSESFVKRKRTTNKVVSLSSKFETYIFEDREFGNSGNMFMNEINDMKIENGYLVVLERNKNTSNGCQIIDNFKLSGNG